MPMDSQHIPAGSAALADTLYEELRRAARLQRFRGGRPDTLQTTALIHEAYIKLSAAQAWESRSHFLAVASRAMRQVLIDAARERLTAKRGGGAIREPIETAEAVQDGGEADEELVRLNGALEALAQVDAELTRIVECRFFGGMTEPEIATALGISERTVRRRWVQARAWIHREMME